MHRLEISGESPSLVIDRNSIRPLRTPQAKAAGERIRIVTKFAIVGDRLQFRSVSAAEHDIIGNERVGKDFDDLMNISRPAFLAVLIERLDSNRLFKCIALAIRQMRQLCRDDDMLGDQARTKASAETKKQHSTALV